MRYHIAKQFEGKLENGSFPNVKGKTYFVGCHSYGKIWRNDQVLVREFKYTPSWAFRCEFCSHNIEEFEGKIYKFADGGKVDTTPIYGQYALIKRKEWKRWHLAKVDHKYSDSFWICCGSTIDSKYSPAFDHLDVILIEGNIVPMPYHQVCYRCRVRNKELVKYWQFKTASELAKEEADEMMKAAKENPMEINPGFSDDDLPVFTSISRADEEDILDSDEERVLACLRSNVGTGGRENIAPPYFECIKCKRKYAMDSSYIPLDGTGIILTSYPEHTGLPNRRSDVYRCVCGYPILTEIVYNSVGMKERVFIGRPVVKSWLS